MEPLLLFPAIDKEKITLDLFQAYFDARKNKRNTVNALAFEKHFESNLFSLCNEIVENKYQPKPSICFIVDKPVQREIFAADFRDRVVHHLIIGKLNPLFEKTFIHDSYACRTGKGTHFGIKRIDKFIRQCSLNYSNPCYILKLDVQGFFMHINRDILYEGLHTFIEQNYHQTDKALIMELCHKIVYNQPTENCIIKGTKTDWHGLPKNKSLFHSPPNCGLPIGNLTSQVFANFYMNPFDHFVKKKLGIRFYGRYVDDMVLIHPSKDKLLQIIPIIRDYLSQNLGLTLHPNKMYLQHYSKGVQFLGTAIKPYRIYIANRTKGNFYGTIEKQNQIARHHKPTNQEQSAFLSSINSYLGIMQHYKTYKLRKQMLLKNLSGWWWNYFFIVGYSKLVFKRQ